MNRRPDFERGYGVCKDLQEMFHQIRKIQKKKRLTIIMVNTPKDNPDIKFMNVLTFGASCSPSFSKLIKY